MVAMPRAPEIAEKLPLGGETGLNAPSIYPPLYLPTPPDSQSETTETWTQQEDGHPTSAAAFQLWVGT